MADHSGVHMSRSPYLRVPGSADTQCGHHPASYCASNDWGVGLHKTQRRMAEAYLADYKRLNGSLCGAENPNYPGEYFCSFESGHDRISDIEFDPVDGELGGPYWDHAAPEFGAAWNLPKPVRQKSDGGAVIARGPKEKLMTILDAKTLAFISAMIETLNSFPDDKWPDLYVTVDLKTRDGDKIGAFTDEYGDWVFETSSDGE